MMESIEGESAAVGGREGLSRLKDRILDEARAAAEEVRSAARKEAEAILREAEALAERRREEILSRAREEAAERKQRIITLAELEARKAILSAKEELIEEVFREGLQALLDLDEGSYRAMLKGMILDAAPSGESEIEVILSDRDRERLGQAFLDEVSEELRATRRSGRLAMSAETRGLAGGFILKTRAMEINSSLEAIVAGEREELLARVAGILFGH
ncbi:MAG TPA: hypothetical protein GXX51_11480 [Firmicutes bacterium]|nr:hypothetical protein [Bacillota bacterium]